MKKVEKEVKVGPAAAGRKSQIHNKKQSILHFLEKKNAVPEVEVPVLHWVHLCPPPVLAVDLVGGRPDPRVLADGDVVRPRAEALKGHVWTVLNPNYSGDCVQLSSRW